MRHIIRLAGLVICAFLVLGAGTVKAAGPDELSAKDKQMLEAIGHSFQKIPDTFNCTQFSAANFVSPAHTIAHFEYVPKGDDVSKWTRMVSITVYTLSDDPQMMTALVNGTLTQFNKMTKVSHQEIFNSKSNAPGLYFEYTVDAGNTKENGAAIFLRTASKAAAFIQVQSRGTPLDPADAAKLKDMLARAGKK